MNLGARGTLRFVPPLILGVMIRVVMALGDNVTSADESVYLGLGKSIWSGHGLTYRGEPQLHFPPLLPIILGGLAKITPTPHVATVVFTFVTSVALMVLVALLARRIGGDKAGLIALWFAAVTPGIAVTVARSGGSEAPFAALVIASVLVAAGTTETVPSRTRALVVGLLVGLLYLLRPEGIALGAVFGLVLAFRAVGARLGRDTLSIANARYVASLAGAMLGGVTILAAPYVLFLHSKTGAWEITDKSSEYSIQTWRNLADRDRLSRDLYAYRLDATGHRAKNDMTSLSKLARSYPSEALEIAMINVKREAAILAKPEKARLKVAFLSMTTVRWPTIVLPLLPFALFGAWRGRRSPAALAAVGVVGVTLATYVTFFAQDRYMPPVVAALTALGAAGIASLTSRYLKIWTGVVVALSVVSVVSFWDGPTGLRIPKQRTDVPQAAAWIRSQPGRGTVMSRSRFIGYYVPNNRVLVPCACDVAQLWNYARFHNTRYLVLDPITIGLRPEFEQLADGRDHSDLGFKLRHTVTIGGTSTVVLEVLPKRAETFGYTTTNE